MASRDVSFSLHLVSSYDEQQSPLQSPPQYRAGALPKLMIPFPFQSEESSLDLGSGDETPSTPGTPSTPFSPLGSEFSFLAVSSQTSEDGEFASPRPRKNASASDVLITWIEGLYSGEQVTGLHPPRLRNCLNVRRSAALNTTSSAIYISHLTAAKQKNKNCVFLEATKSSIWRYWPVYSHSLTVLTGLVTACRACINTHQKTGCSDSFYSSVIFATQ